MMKFGRRCTKLINSTYFIYFRKPHFKQFTTAFHFNDDFRPVTKIPSFYNHNTHCFNYSTAPENAPAPVLDIDECGGFSGGEEDKDEDGDGDREDELEEEKMEARLSGLKDEEFNHQVEILLGILKRHEREGEDEGEDRDGDTGVLNAENLKECGNSPTCSTGVVPGVEVANALKEGGISPTCSTGVVTGVEVAKKLKECGISPTCSTGAVAGVEVTKKLKEGGISPTRSTRTVNGIEVAKKLKECGIIPAPEVVVEVLTRTRNDWEVAFMFFLWVGKLSGYEHSLREYHSMISILAKKRKFDTAWILIDEMRKKGVVNPNTLLIMMRRYCATHDVVSAVNTFHAFKRFGFSVGMSEFHNLLSALTRYKNVQEAEYLLFSNRNLFPFNTKSFNIVLNGWCNVVGNPRESNRFWKLMINQGIKLDVISYSSIILSFSKFNKVKGVVKLFNEMTGSGLEPDRKVYNAFMYALAKAGQGGEALKYLKIMQDKGIAPDSATFNSLIKPLCRARCRAEAETVYEEMLRRGLRPTVRTFHAFMRIQRTEDEIFTLLDKMKELGCSPNKDTYLLLIRKCLRWQKLDTAFMFWDKMKENGWSDDSSSYIALIHGLFLNGKLEEAHRLYVEMKRKSLLPDAKTEEHIQTWLSNKEMAVSPTVNPGPSW